MPPNGRQPVAAHDQCCSLAEQAGDAVALFVVVDAAIHLVVVGDAIVEQQVVGVGQGESTAFDQGERRRIWRMYVQDHLRLRMLEVDARMNVVGHLAQLALARDDIAFQIADEEIARTNFMKDHAARVDQHVLGVGDHRAVVVAYPLVPFLARAEPKRRCEIDPQCPLGNIWVL